MAGLVVGVVDLKVIVVVVSIVVVVMKVVDASRMVDVAVVGEAKEVVDVDSIVVIGPLTWKMRGTSPLLGDSPLSK